MRHRIVLAAAAALTAAALSGCADEGAPPREEMARAHTLVSQADKSSAQRYAADDLQRAHSELDAAERAYGEKHYLNARTDAENAAVDADLASARAAAGEAEHAANQVARDNSTLQRETERAADASSPPPPPPPPPPPQP